MCGRFTIAVTRDEMISYLQENFQIPEFEIDYNLPRYNVSPTQDILTIINDGSKYRVGKIRWGFVPFFAKEINTKYLMINARKDSLITKNFYKDSLLNKRCLILSDGFYEWAKTTNGKIPYYIKIKNKKLYTYAGLYSKAIIDGKPLFTTTIITTNANQFMEEIHDRMPIILDEDNAKKWLDTNNQDLDNLLDILNQYDSSKMIKHPVSKLVNKPDNDFIDCIIEEN